MISQTLPKTYKIFCPGLLGGVPEANSQTKTLHHFGGEGFFVFIGKIDGGLKSRPSVFLDAGLGWPLLALDMDRVAQAGHPDIFSYL